MSSSGSKDDERRRLGFTDLAVHLPVGILVAIAHDVPGLVERGRAQIRQDVVIARFLGKMAVEQGGRVARSGIERRVRRTLGVDGSGEEEAIISPRDVMPGAADGSIGVAAAEFMSSGDDLPIPGYDELAAPQIIERLAALQPDELERVELHERGHRRRRTVLGRIDQIRSGMAQ
jgi:hypothetical protein